MITNSFIVSRIIQARKEAHISESELACRIGRHRNTIICWRIKGSKIGVIELMQIAEITGKPLSFFIGQ
jgi:transcriptional regulator with XRE-family HTH domain